MTELPEPSIPDFLMFSFESQAEQFPLTGKPGLTESVEHVGDLEIDTLLWRVSPSGFLVGILYYYPQDCFEIDGTLLEKAGNFNIYVRRDDRRRGIGTILMREAMNRWPIDFAQQRYTAAGRALAAKILEARS